MNRLLTPLLAPEKLAATGSTNPVVLNQKTLAALVGLIAIALPWVLWFGSFAPALCTQNSISHYYYVPILGSVFVGLMGFIGLFMMGYRGHTRSDRIFANVGGGLALVVAFFPASNDGCGESAHVSRPFFDYALVTDPAAPLPQGALHYDFILTDAIHIFGAPLTTNMLHLTAAFGLFCILGWFALISFRRDNGEGVAGHGDHAVKSRRKTWRNRIYTVCGLTIFACIVILGLLPDRSDGSDSPLPAFFLAEAVALMAFGISWSVKGRMVPWLNDVRAARRRERPPPRSRR